ncbi:MAG: amino acid permease [Halanaerobiales bacterium]
MDSDMPTNKQQQQQSKEVQSELSREITLFQLTMMGAGMMIGAGVFVATGIATGISGTGGILIAFTLNGIVALFSAISMAELASAIPAAGGVYTYIREAFGGIIGFISGWMNWFALAIAGSLYAKTFASYSLHLIRQLDINFISFIESNPRIYENILAILIALLFISINYLGASETGGSASYIAMAQTATLGIIGIIGVIVAFLQPENMTNFTAFVPHGWGKVLAAMGFTYIGFEGYEVITHAGEEAVNPKEDIPKAIFYSLIIVVTTYILMAFAVVIGAPVQGLGITEWFTEMGELGVAEAISNLFPFGGLFITLAAIFASTSALNATTFSATRVAFALGRKKELPSFLSNISKKRKIPHIALLLTGVIIVPVAVFFPIKDVAASTDIVFLLLFLLVNVSVIKIRREKGDKLDYSFVMPYFPYIPLIAIISQSFLAIKLFDVSSLAWFTTIFWLAAGFIIYFTFSRSRIKKREKEKAISPIIEEKRDLKTLTTSAYQVMVPIANENNAATLIRYAEKIAVIKKAQLILMSVLTVPDQTPLEEAEQFSSEKHNLLVSARDQIKENLPVNSILRTGRDVSRAIITSAQERETNLLVLGWSGKIKSKYFELGSNLDNIIENAPCDCVIIKPGLSEKLGDKEINHILFPTNGGFQSILAAEICSILAKSFGAEVTVLNINRNNESNEVIKDRLDKILFKLNEENYNIKIKNNDEIIDGILEESESENIDLVIMGATGEGYFQQLLFGKISEKVASESNKTVILAKKNVGLRSLSRRWLGRRSYLSKDGITTEEEE